MDNIEQIIADTLLERPFCLEVDREYVYLYPMTLGMTYLSAGIIRNLKVNQELLRLNPNVELIRLYVNKQDLCLRLIAINTLQGKMALDNRLVEKRIELFRDIDIDEAVTLLSYILQDSQIDGILQHYGIDKDISECRKAEKAKSNDSVLTFCGKSVWGSVIDSLASKYHWTMDYILWGISYANIQMLLADSIKTVYISREEQLKAGVINRATALDGNDPKVWENLKDFHWD